MRSFWRNNPAWTDHFSVVLYDLLDPNSALARQHPYLHHVFQTRLNTSMAVRNNRLVSLCNHTEEYAARADTFAYQRTIGKSLPKYENSESNKASSRCSSMCSDIKDEMEILGRLGSGSFGTVFLAREFLQNSENDEEDSTFNPDDHRYFAIKVQEYETMDRVRISQKNCPSMATMADHGVVRYISIEALILLFLTSDNRFPAFHQVYKHENNDSILMEAPIDYEILHALREAAPEPYNTRVRAFNGHYLLDPFKEPLLNELEACKVSSQLLEGIAQLRDMRFSHDDLSRNNYLIDQNLNARLIDLGLNKFGLQERNFQDDQMSYLAWMEIQMSPELATEMMKSNLLRKQQASDNQVDVYLPHDVRTTELWKFGCIIFEILHGFAPWEDPEWNPEIPPLMDFHHKNPNHASTVAAYARRRRILKEELPIEENLSQDCADLLQMMFAKEPGERPTVDELASFPWFNQSAYHDEVFRRPFSQRYWNHVEHLF